MEEKLKILETAENKKGFYGHGVFSTSTYPFWQNYYTMYQELSGYIHFSYSKVAHHIREIVDQQTEVVNYSYDKQKFLDAYHVWRQVTVLALEMAVQIGKVDDPDIPLSISVFEQ